MVIETIYRLINNCYFIANFISFTNRNDFRNSYYMKVLYLVLQSKIFISLGLNECNSMKM